MATFEGTFEDFNVFVGPLARNIVSNLSRKHKKKTTCRHEGCNKRKPLEAAHIKGKERVLIIYEILKSYQKEDEVDSYMVDLKKFETDFIAAHTPIEDIILPMCKEHHLEYDKKENIPSEYPIILTQFENEQGEDLYTEEELIAFEQSEYKLLKDTIQDSNQKTIKSEIQDKYNLEKSQVAFSRISEANGLWNFDVAKMKFANDFAFIFYDQNEKDYKAALIKANTIKTSDFAEKSPKTARFLIDKDFKDRCGFNFKAYLENLQKIS